MFGILPSLARSWVTIAQRRLEEGICGLRARASSNGWGTAETRGLTRSPECRRTSQFDGTPLAFDRGGGRLGRDVDGEVSNKSDGAPRQTAAITAE